MTFEQSDSIFRSFNGSDGVDGKRVIAVEDIPRDAALNSELMESLGWRAAIFAPLLTKDQAIGVLVCSDDSRERKFTDEEIFRAESLRIRPLLLLENARLFQVISRSQRMGNYFRRHAGLRFGSRHHRQGDSSQCRARPPFEYDPAESDRQILFWDLQPGWVARYQPVPPYPTLKSEALFVEEVALPIMGGVFQISVSPWFDKDNRLVGSIHVAKDISNEKQLQQQLIQSEKLSAIGELISGIAHELNNPLTGVMGYSQLLQLRKDLDDRAKESLFKDQQPGVALPENRPESAFVRPQSRSLKERCRISTTFWRKRLN